VLKLKNNSGAKRLIDDTWRPRIQNNLSKKEMYHFWMVMTNVYPVGLV